MKVQRVEYFSEYCQKRNRLVTLLLPEKTSPFFLVVFVDGNVFRKEIDSYTPGVLVVSFCL